MSQIQCVGVVGAGLMGTGIAEVTAAAGVPTIVVKATPGAPEEAKRKLARSLADKVERGQLAASTRDEILGLITFTGDRDRLMLADLVVETIVEDAAKKRALFASLDAILPAHVILASNTSSLRIGELARDLRADRIIGLHFFAPVARTKLVELAHLPETRPEVIAAASALVSRLGKSAVPIVDATGFVVNRLLVPFLLGAVAAVEQGLACAEDIDKAMRLGAGHPVGPLALADLIGLDTLYAMAKLLELELGDVRYQVPPLLERLVESGHLGKKSGRGFYQYGERDTVVAHAA